MPKNTISTLDVRTRPDWRRWLRKHCASSPGIWLVFHKRHTGIESLGYDDAVEEALCFGWIDSLIKRLDADRYARKFTPRKPDSVWSEINRRRYADLKDRGLLEAPGLERPPTGRSYPAPPSEISPAVKKRLMKNLLAWDRFQKMPPSRRRACVAWVESAKREATREKRLRELVDVLVTGRTLGMK